MEPWEVVPTKAKCPRCGCEFMKQYFYVCGGCLTDMELANRGLSQQHYCHRQGIHIEEISEVKNEPIPVR